MRVVARLVATLIVAASAGAAIAQDHGPVAPVPSPTLPNGVGPESPIKAIGKIPFHGEMLDAILYVQGNRAALLLRDAQGNSDVKGIETTSDALALLADRRVAFLWPALLDWAGHDLGKLRVFSVADAAANYAAGLVATAPNSTAESSVRPKTMLLLKYAEALHHAGRIDEASDILRKARDTMRRRNDWERAEWVMVSTRMASYAYMRSGADAALDILEDAQTVFANDTSYGINFAINRAVNLALAGRYALALDAIDTARARYDAFMSKGREGTPVPGSERQFAWIRACALHGLGREAEARAALAPALVTEEPQDRYFKLDSNTLILERAYKCMGDAGELVKILVAQADANPVGAHAALLLEPAAHPEDMAPALLAAVRADPRMKALAAARFRPLPPDLVPALDNWAAQGR